VSKISAAGIELARKEDFFQEGEVIEMRRTVRLFLLTASIFFFILPQVSNAFTIFQSWQHPRVVGKFWRLPYNPALIGGSQKGGYGIEGEGGIYQLPEGLYSWDSDTVRFLRRFDVLSGSSFHVLSYEQDIGTEDSVIAGEDLTHNLFGRNYNHSTEGNHSGSKQDLIGKSRWGLLSRGYDQVFFGARTIDKIDSAQLEVNNLNHPRRELVDWVSPAWFCFGVGGRLKYGLSNADTIDVVIELIFFTVVGGIRRRVVQR